MGDAIGDTLQSFEYVIREGLELSHGYLL